ncbi:MAG TPA: PEP/pyruvate-binding domain-containing protein [Thermoleophilaceae bacterium]
MAAELTRSLADLRQADTDSFGGKSSTLGELIAAEIPVPPGFALSCEAFRLFVEQAGLRGVIAHALERASSGDVDAVNRASHSISEAMHSAPMPAAVRDEVTRHYAELGDVPVAVRSSALGEDSQEATFAGQQETYLWIRGAGQVCDAIRDCWISLYSPPAIAYRARLGEKDEEPAMGVTVQLMVDAEVSGVMFTCNPVSGDPSMVAINASWGLGLAVVGGEVTPDDYLVSKVTREVVRENISSKTVEYVPGEAGTVFLDVPEERRDIPCLDEPRIATLVDVGKRVERYFGSRQDIEWAFARGDGELFVVQSRPVTGIAKPKEEKKPTSAMSLLMSTFGAEKKQ